MSFSDHDNNTSNIKEMMSIICSQNTINEVHAKLNDVLSQVQSPTMK